MNFRPTLKSLSFLQGLSFSESGIFLTNFSNQKLNESELKFVQLTFHLSITWPPPTWSPSRTRSPLLRRAPASFLLCVLLSARPPESTKVILESGLQPVFLVPRLFVLSSLLRDFSSGQFLSG